MMPNSTTNGVHPEFLETLSYRTPYFLFSRKKVLENFHKFRELFPGSSIYYAMKANSELGILQVLSDAGCGFEVASVYELSILQKIKVPPGVIIYGSSVKPTSHIKELFDYGVDRFAVDSFSELEKIAAAAPGSRVYVRKIVDDSDSVFKFSEKFGAEAASVVPLLLRAKELGLTLYGISFHVGSQASNPQAWGSALKSLYPIIKELSEMGITIDILNLGGGYPCKYISTDPIPSLEAIARYTLEQYRNLPYQPKLILEPGRGIVADTGVLVVSVIAKVERQGQTWLFLDAGCYNGLFESMAYQGSTRYPITSMRPVNGSGEYLFALAGPTGDSPDIITREAWLPQDTKVGDKLIIHKVGAYSLVAASPFNGFPKPDIYFTDSTT